METGYIWIEGGNSWMDPSFELIMADVKQLKARRESTSFKRVLWTQLLVQDRLLKPNLDNGRSNVELSKKLSNAHFLGILFEDRCDNTVV